MKRNYGVDFLRILSMFMVVILHILGQGGILAHAVPLSHKYWVAWFLEIVCYCAVDCFALISGYVMCQSKYKISKIAKLWLQTIFYTFLAVIVFYIFLPDAINTETILNAIFPITSSQYWYITAYFGMLFLVPLLNTAINHTDKKVFGSVLLSVFIFFCVFPTLFRTDPYILNGGYSFIWLSILYLAGGYIHKYGIDDKIKNSHAWLTVLLMFVISFLISFVPEQYLHDFPMITAYKNSFISYTSPTIVLISVGLLVACSKLNFKPWSIKLIRFISPAVLGVYLSHVNPLVWVHVIAGFSIPFLNYNCVIMVCLILLSALLIFIAGIVIDLVRIKLFELLKLNNLCALLETWLG